MAGHDFWAIMPKSRPIHRLARGRFLTLVANSNSAFLEPFTPTVGYWELTKSDPSLAAIRVWAVGPENGGWMAMIPGISCQNRGQPIDSPEDPLF